jgi:energy-coupling factor transporter ATP-binding protein EcfA2
MAIEFTPAVRTAIPARIALTGPSGSGKTWTALMLACALGHKPAVIDTERRRASLYAGINGWQFDCLNPTSFAPASLTQALAVASGAGIDALVIDSLSHYWSGVDGMQEQADRRAKGGNNFSGWKEARPDERRMFDAIASYPGHVIVTLRVKTSYVIEQVEKNGRTVNVPKKIGMKPDQREGIEFEFDLVGDMDTDNAMTVTKTRLPMLAGATITKPDVVLADTIAAWLAEGEATAGPLAYRERALDADLTYQAARALHDEVKVAGLLAAPVLDAEGEPTVLGELIATIGTRLKVGAA